MKVLAGDLGGTKTILAIAEVVDGRVQLLEKKRYASEPHSDFTSLVLDFLSGIKYQASQACFGVAGPVIKGRAELTNLPWVLVESDLQRDLRLTRIRLINDFVAIAFGIEALSSCDLETLNPARSVPGGTVAVIGAGTGLGEAIVMRATGKRVVVPSEGGHSDFAARNDLQIDFLRYMIDKYGHVSYERVLSGPGLANIYEFFRDTGLETESDELRQAIAEADDRAPVIQRFADDKRDPLCEAVLDLFISVYGAEAGNLALKAVATGGVYVAGGIAPRIIHRLKAGEFQRSFLAKGRLADEVAAMPVYVVMNNKVGLLGAAVAAAEL
jgi:glucokinase